MSWKKIKNELKENKKWFKRRKRRKKCFTIKSLVHMTSHSDETGRKIQEWKIKFCYFPQILLLQCLHFRVLQANSFCTSLWHVVKHICNVLYINNNCLAVAFKTDLKTLQMLLSKLQTKQQQTKL
jgi:hypothetical protein